MRRVAIYGKGGIGKSTTSCNITAALCDRGLKVMQIGCDPKSDSTRMLLNGKRYPTVLETMRKGDVDLDDIVHEGYGGSLCVECGGPSPGTGCAGRGIIAAFEMLESLDAVDVYKPDVILYDVLGDVVCGGFAMPIRNGYANDVFIVSSGEMMSLYAASNISTAVNNFSSSGYARLCGLIQNSRNVEDENALVDKACKEIGTDVIARIARSPTVQECEKKLMTVIEGAPDSEQAAAYRSLAEKMLSLSKDVDGGMKNL
ncbi:MAG: AAA family ATPase [Candidatus Methanomethylophilaceae archaeon]|nr:AAA family ATPase [Candidatus Methanomethylophilaceae archaeon]